MLKCWLIVARLFGVDDIKDNCTRLFNVVANIQKYQNTYGVEYLQLNRTSEVMS